MPETPSPQIGGIKDGIIKKSDKLYERTCVSDNSEVTNLRKQNPHVIQKSPGLILSRTYKQMWDY